MIKDVVRCAGKNGEELSDDDVLDGLLLTKDALFVLNENLWPHLREVVFDVIKRSRDCLSN